MTINDLEKQILSMLEINSKIDWNMDDTSPKKEFKDLTKIIKKLFSNYRKHIKQ